MGTTFTDVIKRMERVDLRNIAEDAAQETAPQIARMNREQLTQGYDSNDQTLRKYRSAKYAARKNSMNPAPGYGNPDLKLTGAFYRGIRADVDDNGNIHTYSTDSKDPALVKKYGSDIYGLSKANGQKYIDEHLRIEFMQRLRSAAKL